MSEIFFNSFCVHNLSIFHSSCCVVKNISFSLKNGALLALVGPNGSGKTTLLSTLAGLHKNYQGVWGWCQDQDPSTISPLKRKTFAYLPQRNTLDRYFPLNVYQVVSMGLWPSKKWGRSLTKTDHCKIDKALEQTRLSHLRFSPLSVLSGGQFQRMLFARLILQDARLIFLDEPFANIDEETVDEMMNLVLDWSNKGCFVFLSQHNRTSVLRYFPQTLLLARRFHHFGCTGDVLSTENLCQAYEDVNQ